MARLIESEVHEILLDIAPEMQDLSEQAIIVAEATNCYEKIANTEKKIVRFSKEQIRESRITDAILEAIGRLSDWAGYEDIDDTFDYGLNCDSEKLILGSTVSPSHRYSSSEFGSMNIVGYGENELDDIFDGIIEGREADKYFINDFEDAHPEDLYNVPGYGTSRSDSLVR